MKGFLRVFRPRRKIKITSPGKWFLVLTVGVGVAAINTGNNLLYLALSMNLSLIILSGILSEWCLRGLSVRVAHASEAFASRDSLLAVTCSAAGKWLPAFSVSVVPVLPGSGKTAWFPEIPPGGSDTRVIPYRPERRGLIPSFACVVSTRFPFALFEKSAEVNPRGSSLIVYPKPGAVDAEPPGAGPGDHSGGRAARGREGALIRGARDHSPSDPVRDIHWKASARLGKWMVKEREAEPAQTVDLHLLVPSPAEEFERLVSRACALLLLCEREGLPYRLRIGDRILVDLGDTDRRRRTLSILARVAPDGTLPPAEKGERP